jgi:hypothetical protein
LARLVSDPLVYYASSGLMTDPKEFGAMFNGLPTSIPELCRVVQGVLVHVFWAERQGLKLSAERKQEVNIRSVADKLALIRKLNDKPLTVARPLEERLVGNCRDFSVMLCAMLRYQGVPARTRCGFGTYFQPDHFEDHWVCEYWKADEQRWVMVDAQLDALQRQVLQIKFDPCDLSMELFLSGGRAWQLCRAGEADPDRFGIFDMHGLWFVLGDFLRDMASLNKLELLPWDSWGFMEKGLDALSAEELALLDHVTTLFSADNGMFDEIRSLYEKSAGLRVPKCVKSYTAKGVQTFEIG